MKKYDGPFKIKDKIGGGAYKLKLSEILKLYPLFHMSYLKPFYEDHDDLERSKS